MKVFIYSQVTGLKITLYLAHKYLIVLINDVKFSHGLFVSDVVVLRRVVARFGYVHQLQDVFVLVEISDDFHLLGAQRTLSIIENLLMRAGKRGETGNNVSVVNM